MDAHHIMALLGEACSLLEGTGDHAAAAHIGHAMDMISTRHGVPLPPGEPPCGQPE